MDATNETTSEQPQTKLSRLFTLICDSLPGIGTVTEHQFITSLGAGVVFSKAEPFFHQGKKHQSFKLRVNEESPLWSSVELRELSQECIAMAEYLEKKSG